MSADLVALFTIVLLVNPNAVELYIWMGVLSCGYPISINVFRNGIIFLAVMYNAAISASAADAMTVLMICEIVKTGPLSFGFGSFYERNICAPARLLDFYSLRKPASACAAKIISIFRKSMSSSG